MENLPTFNNFTFYWKLRDKNLFDTSNWFEILEFNRGLSTNIENVNVNEHKGFSLSQNYPNPFNPATQFSYSIKTSGIVQWQVYDVFGKDVANLVNGFKRIGSYTVTFDA
ncbi:MAG: hypothetical protein ABJR05_07475 [Balneola sp.]